MYLIHPLSPWSSSPPPSICVCQHHSVFHYPSDRIICPKNPNFLLSAVCCSVSSSTNRRNATTNSATVFSLLSLLLHFTSLFSELHCDYSLNNYNCDFYIARRSARKTEG